MAKKKQRVKKPEIKKNTKDSGFGSFLRSATGQFLTAILIIVALVCINSLIAGKRLDHFLIISAFELIIATVIIWVVLLHRRMI